MVAVMVEEVEAVLAHRLQGTGTGGGGVPAAAAAAAGGAIQAALQMGGVAAAAVLGTAAGEVVVAVLAAGGVLGVRAEAEETSAVVVVVGVTSVVGAGEAEPARTVVMPGGNIPAEAVQPEAEVAGAALPGRGTTWTTSSLWMRARATMAAGTTLGTTATTPRSTRSPGARTRRMWRISARS